MCPIWGLAWCFSTYGILRIAAPTLWKSDGDWLTIIGCADFLGLGPQRTLVGLSTGCKWFAPIQNEQVLASSAPLLPHWVHLVAVYVFELFCGRL